MTRALLDRLIIALLVLLGADPASTGSEHHVTALVLIIAAMVDGLMRYRERRAGADAILRALGLSDDTRPCDDDALCQAIRRAGLSPKAIAESWERSRKG